MSIFDDQGHYQSLIRCPQLGLYVHLLMKDNDVTNVTIPTPTSYHYFNVDTTVSYTCP